MKKQNRTLLFGLTTSLAAGMTGCVSTPQSKHLVSTEYQSNIPSISLTEAQARWDGQGLAVSGMLRKLNLHAHYVTQAHLHASLVDADGKVVWQAAENLSGSLPIPHERLSSVEASHFSLHLAGQPVQTGKMQLQLHEHSARQCMAAAR